MAEGRTIGSAYVQILPSAKGITGKIAEVLDPESRSAGQSAGETIGSQIASFATKAIAALGVGKAISGAITNGMDFESTMAKASTLFSGTTEEFASLQKEIMGISSATGVAASELAEAAYSAESASVPMGNLGGMLEASAKLATAGFTDIDTALSATAKTMNAYGMMSDDVTETQENLEKVQRILIQTQNKGITTVGELGASLAQVTPTAAAFGVSFEQVGASLAGMTAQGTPTAQATTQLNSLIAELGKNGTTAANNLMEAAEGTEYAGMSFNEMMDAGLQLNDVLDMMQGLADENGLAMADMFSSIEAGKAAMSISNSDFVANMEAMATEADVVGDAYDKMSDTVQFKLERMKQTLTNLGIEAFSGVVDILSSALEGVSTVLEILHPHLEALGGAFMALIDAFGSAIAEIFGLDESFSLAETAASILSGAIDGLTTILEFLTEHMDVIAPIVLGVVGAFTLLKTAMAISSIITGVGGAFSLLVSPVGLAVAAIGGAIAIGVTLYKNWDTIKEKAAELKEKISEKWDALKEKTAEVWENARSAVAEKWDAMKEKTSEIAENIRSKAEEKFNAAKEVISGAIETAKGNVQEKLDIMHQAFDEHGGGVQGVLAAAWEGINSVYDSGFSLLDTLTGGKLSEIKDLFFGKFDEIIGDALTWGSDIISNLVSGITGGIQKVRDAVGSVASAIGDFLGFSEPDEGPLSNFHTFMPDMIDLMVQGLNAGIPAVKSAVGDLAAEMKPDINMIGSSYRMQPVMVRDDAESLRAALSGMRIENILMLDGKVAARQLTPLVDKNMGAEDYLASRA